MECFFTGHRGKRVKGVGPLSAPVVLLGEAPGAEEERDGEPFVGPAGRFLWEGVDFDRQRTKWEGLEARGLRRREVRIENVIEVRPPDNHLWRLTPSSIEAWQRDWWENRFSRLGPVEIVPMGNLALNTLRRRPLPLTKKGKWKMRSTPLGPQIDWPDKIHNWRGSIFNVRAENGAKVKCIPNFHPSFIVRGGGDYDCWQETWGRIVGDAAFPELRLDPKCEHLIEPTPRDAHMFQVLVNQTYHKDPKHAVLACDIETLAGGKVVDCIGFSLEENFSITLNLREPWAWAAATALLKHPIAKGWHYGLYDRWVLWRKGKVITNSRWDSQQMHHCLDPRDEHKLAYCASRDLRVRYWKHENKESQDGGGTAIRDPKKRWKYNGKDACYTRALIERYRERLRERDLLRVYREHYRELTDACLRLTQTGFNVDDKARREIERREVAIMLRCLADMDGLAYPLKGSMVTVVKRGKEVQVECKDTIIGKEGGLSPTKVARYFYDVLKCKPFFRRGTGRRTADEIALRKLMRKYKKARPMGNLVLAYRSHAKIRQEVRASIVSDDGRLRSRYSPTTDSGRLRAMKVSEEEGINAQNRDRKSDLRRMFVPDRGQVLVEVDESQAEDRILGGMSGVREALELARTRPGTIDRHVLNAAKIFGEDYEELFAAYKAGDPEADEKRQTGKRTKYACNYGMGGYHMAEVTMVETEGRVVYDPDECEEWIARLKASDPAIEAYQAWIREQLINLGSLTSSWGRTIYFKGLRLSKEDFKAGYALLPQHEVGVNTNRLGFVPCDNEIVRGRWPGAQVVQQGHDSLIVTSPKKHAWGIAKFLCESMGQEREYPGAAGPWTLAMPIGVKIGLNWKDMREWKELPSREEFEECLSGLTL